MNKSPLNTVLLLAALLTGFQADFANACTAFTHRAADGIVFAGNMDLMVPVGGLVMVNRKGIAKRNIRPNEDGTTANWITNYGSVSFNIAGKGFAWGGLNEAGLAIQTLEVRTEKYPKPDHRIPLDNGSWIQYALDMAGSVADVIAMDKTIRPVKDGGYGFHVIVADASGASAVIEYIDEEMVVYTGNTLPVRALSNISYEKALWSYRNDGPRWWWFGMGDSPHRFAEVARRVEQYEPGTHTNSTRHALDSLVRAANHYTLWSVVYNIDKRKVWFRTVRSGNTKHIMLSDFDFSCNAPSLMLDVDTTERGHVADKFQSYGRQENQRVFTEGTTNYGIIVSAENTAFLMDHIESYQCAP
jgi:penicillin V acylase-like amidase (Ntn superfamily)